MGYFIIALLVNFCQVCRVLFSEHLVQTYIFDGVMNFKECNLQSIFIYFLVRLDMEYNMCYILYSLLENVVYFWQFFHLM